MNENRLALKPYLESIREHCGHLTKEELLEIILGLSREIPVKRRGEFLEKITMLSERRVTVVDGDDVLRKIEALEEDIRERAASIEDSSYYDDYDGWDYDDEEPDLLSDDQKRDLEEFFRVAGSLFLAGRLEEAREVYRALFSLLYGFSEETESYSPGIDERNLNVELREERARYCRCVYETVSSDQRAQAMLDAVNVGVFLSQYHFNIFENDHPMLLDVINSKPGDLAGWKTFLEEWIGVLSTQTSDRAGLLLLEAVYMLEGIGGVERRVRSWGARQPRGYLFWAHLLVSEDDWHGVTSVAEEAVNVLPAGHFRALASHHLLHAGEKLNRKDLVLKGKRELFYSLPADDHLLRLMEEAEKQGVRAPELEKSVEVLSAREREEKTLLVKALLMAGRIESAFEKAKSSKALGWSYGENSAAVLFGGILSVLVLDRIEEARTIVCVLKRYADKGAEFSCPDMEEESVVNRRISDEILDGLKTSSLSCEERKMYLSWARKIGRNRIDQIVSNKHRKAYTRAAEVLIALAECYFLTGEGAKSRKIVEEYRDGKYSRHYAFRREVDTVLDASILRSSLSGM